MDVKADGYCRHGYPEEPCPVCSGTPEEAVHNPPHYTNGRTIEPLDAIVDWKLDFCLGNVVKYISRAGRKEDETPLRALEKARYYLERAIKELEKQKGP